MFGEDTGLFLERDRALLHKRYRAPVQSDFGGYTDVDLFCGDIRLFYKTSVFFAEIYGSSAGMQVSFSEIYISFAET